MKRNDVELLFQLCELKFYYEDQNHNWKTE